MAGPAKAERGDFPRLEHLVSGDRIGYASDLTVEEIRGTIGGTPIFNGEVLAGIDYARVGIRIHVGSKGVPTDLTYPNPDPSNGTDVLSFDLSNAGCVRGINDITFAHEPDQGRIQGVRLSRLPEFHYLIRPVAMGAEDFPLNSTLIIAAQMARQKVRLERG